MIMKLDWTGVRGESFLNEYLTIFPSVTQSENNLNLAIVLIFKVKEKLFSYLFRTSDSAVIIRYQNVHIRSRSHVLYFKWFLR